MEPDWEDRPLQTWMDNITRESTREVYRAAFRAYTEFTGLTATQMIKEVVSDEKASVLRRQNILQKRIIGFYKFLKTEYGRKSRGRGERKVVGTGLSDNLAITYCGAVRSFYSEFGFTVRLKGRKRLPKPKTANPRMVLSSQQVRTLVDNARNLRDKAMILTIFQSGMDISTVCSLDYGQVEGALADGKVPLKVDLHRPKTGVDYYSFLGKDAIDAIRLYVRDMRSRGLAFKSSTPLFLKEREYSKQERMTPNLFQVAMVDIAIRAGFLQKEDNATVINPAGTHALRKSFGSIMLNSGVPDTVVDFWLGHEVGSMALAYKRLQFEEVKKMYVGRETLLSLAGGQRLSEKDFEEVAELKKWEGIVEFANMSSDFPASATEAASIVEEKLGRALQPGERIQLFRAIARRLSKGVSSEETPEVRDWISFIAEETGTDMESLHTWLTVKSHPNEEKADPKEIIGEEDLPKYLSDGWDIQLVLPSGKILVRK